MMPYIAVLGWGSLIWNPGSLRIVGKWFKDGPYLPIEFARISRDGRLTLVLFPDTDKIPVLWAYMSTNNLEESIESLKQREGTTNKNIGFVKVNGENRSNVIPNISKDIREWAQKKKIKAVIWTDLPSNFEKKTGTQFTEDNVIEYLKNLQPDVQKKAEEYIRKAPSQIRTRIRKIIEEKLGWTCNSLY